MASMGHSFNSPGAHGGSRAGSSLDGVLEDYSFRDLHHWCLMRPNQSKKVAWDVMGIVLIAWDVMWLPLNLSFDPEPILFTDFMFWLTLIFWTSDIALSFITGFYKNGEIVMHRAKIARNYLTTWFIPDCLI